MAGKKMGKKIGIDALTKTLAQNTQQWQHFLQQPSQESKKAKTLNRKKFNCDYCKRKFVYLTGLARHLKRFHPEENKSVPAQVTEETTPASPQEKTFDIVIKCKECGEIFPEVKRFEAHTIRYNWELMFASSECDVGSLFMEQVFIVAIHTAILCEFCDACFSDYASLFYHEAHHSPTSGYMCRFCKLNFPKLESVLEHRAQCYEYTNFRSTYLLNILVVYGCNVCMALFPTLTELYEHRYNDHHYFPRRINAITIQAEPLETLWLPCELCGLCCNNIKALLEHRNEQHYVASPDDGAPAEKPSTTQQSTVRRNESRKENRTTKEPNHGRQYLCEKCGKTYTQSSHLWQHLRFHNGVKPFACTVQGCTRRFTIRPDLSDHIRKCHTGERPYKCDQCQKRFLTGSVFYQHRLIHRNERRHVCHDCGRRFYRADALKNHLRIHTGEKPYDCPNCDRKFRQRGDREKHIRVKHSKFN